jgi:hypothetical protein
VCPPSTPVAAPAAPRVVPPRVTPPPRPPATGLRPARAPAPAGLMRNVPSF